MTDPQQHHRVRRNPDVMLVGETRDRETARTSVEGR
jgi:type II secretory ATPase GspE/PulE/Tfp pilus assembly ATPase PilB-like protein